MNLEANKEYSVNWKNHMSHVRKAFDHLLTSNELTDVTLCCEGKKMGAHKILLSACSAYFRDTFKEVPCQHPVIILYGVEYSVLLDILRFIYNGEVSVDTSKLDSFLKLAQMLQISGLTDNHNEKIIPEGNDKSQATTSSQATQEIYTEQYSTTAMPDAAPTSGDETKKGIKRSVSTVKQQETPSTKIQRQDENALFISDVKCEPSELVNFEDPLEDPLQSDQSQDTREFFGDAASQNSGEEEFKIERGFFEATAVLETETKVKHSNFSVECLKCPVCNKIFSHPYSLHHHKAVHSGNTQCPICHAVLSRRYNLKMHMKARHNL